MIRNRSACSCTATTSLWLPSRLLRPANQASLVDALVEGSQSAPILLHFNKGLSGAPPRALDLARETATNPAVLDAFTLVIVANGGPPAYPGVPWKPADPAIARRDAEAVDRAMAPFYRLVPDAWLLCLREQFLQSPLVAGLLGRPLSASAGREAAL